MRPYKCRKHGELSEGEFWLIKGKDGKISQGRCKACHKSTYTYIKQSLGLDKDIPIPVEMLELRARQIEYKRVLKNKKMRQVQEYIEVMKEAKRSGEDKK